MSKKTKPLPYNTNPHYITEEYRSRKLSINELRLLLWLRLIGNPYSKAVISLSDLKDDVFPDFDFKPNTITKLLHRLRQKQYIYFESRQGKTGTFMVELNHWFLPNKLYKTLDKKFGTKTIKRSMDEEEEEHTPYTQDTSSEDRHKLEVRNQKSDEQKKQLIDSFSMARSGQQIRSSHNEHDTEHQNYNHGNTLEKTFNGTPTKDFLPKNYEEETVQRIASDVKDPFINPLLSIYRKYGLRIIQDAWEILKENRERGKYIEKTEAAYLMAIIKKLVTNNGQTSGN